MYASDIENISDKSPARLRILHAAHKLFYQYGIRGVGVDWIIAEAGVTKVTFYRHYPSKQDLVRSYLDYRHERWMTWIQEAIQSHGGDLEGMVLALQEWFSNPTFRGCAFLNTLGELGGSEPEWKVVVAKHKESFRSLLASLLPDNPERETHASILALTIDGAIMRAEWGDPLAAIEFLREIIRRCRIA